MSTTRVDHVNIVVSDIETSVRFYTEVFGLTRGFEKWLEGEWIERVSGLQNVRAHCVFLKSEDSTVRLELLQYVSPASQNCEINSLPNTHGLRHVAFLVEDFGEFLKRLESAGGKPLGAPTQVPFEVGGLGRKTLCYFLDPDGTLLEAASYQEPES